MRETRDQKARTREAILAGARELIARGRPVTVAAAAAARGVSRATAYRYFSSPSTLAAEAGLAMEVASYDEVIAGAASPHDRALSICLYFLDLSLAHEREFRRFLARNLDASLEDDDPSRPRRGARRVAMFRRALAPEAARLGEERLAALVRALTVATGTEAMIALLDIARADRAQARETVAEIAGVLLTAWGVTRADLPPEPSAR